MNDPFALDLTIRLLMLGLGSAMFAGSFLAFINKDKINIIIVRKYLFISSRLKLIFVKINLFIKTFLGLLKDKIWFRENLNSE